MNIVQRAKDRLGGVIAAVVAGIVFCCCGALMTFYLAPSQALDANRIKNLPQMDATYVLTAAPGEDVQPAARVAQGVHDDSFADEHGVVDGVPGLGHELRPVLRRR